MHLRLAPDLAPHRQPALAIGARLQRALGDEAIVRAAAEGRAHVLDADHVLAPVGLVEDIVAVGQDRLPVDAQRRAPRDEVLVHVRVQLAAVDAVVADGDVDGAGHLLVEERIAGEPVDAGVDADAQLGERERRHVRRAARPVDEPIEGLAPGAHAVDRDERPASKRSTSGWSSRSTWPVKEPFSRYSPVEVPSTGAMNVSPPGRLPQVSLSMMPVLVIGERPSRPSPRRSSYGRPSPEASTVVRTASLPRSIATARSSHRSWTSS